MYLALHTETTDIPHPHLTLDHPEQPHLLRFAGILFDEDGTELESLITKVRPCPGVMLSNRAFAEHGISLEDAFHCGREVSEVLRWFTSALERVTCIVGHGVRLDLQIMAIVSARVGDIRWSVPRTFCTMAHSALWMNLSPTVGMMAKGHFHPRPPSLSECIEHFFDEEAFEPGDPEAKVRSCVRIFLHLSRRRRVT